MLYEFKTEDLQLHKIAEDLGVVPFFRSFLMFHSDKVSYAFEKVVSELKKEEKSEHHTRFICELNCKEFAEAVEFAFEVIFAKDFTKMLETHDLVVLSLSAHSLARKMVISPNNAVYVGQLERILNNCCDSIKESYRKLANSNNLTCAKKDSPN